MNDAPLVELRGVSRLDPQNQRRLIDQITMQLDPGDRVGLIGPSGSGKTTLLRAIARLDAGVDGEVRFRGQSIPADQVPVYRRQVIYLAQHPAFSAVTVRENLELPFTFASAQPRARLDWDRVANWLTQLDRPRTLLDQPATSLSGGERQIVALIRALLLTPQILLLDEPTAAIDEPTVCRFEQLIMQWYHADQDRAFIWASHDHEQVERMTIRQIELREGRRR